MSYDSLNVGNDLGILLGNITESQSQMNMYSKQVKIDLNENTIPEFAYRAWAKLRKSSIRKPSNSPVIRTPNLFIENINLYHFINILGKFSGEIDRNKNEPIRV